MARRSPAARVLFLLFAAAQFALPGVAAWADGEAERASWSSAAGPHVEATTESECPRIHPADCALCHAACTAFTRVAPAPLVLTVRRSEAPGPDAVRARASNGGVAWDARPRAPPSRD